MSMGHETMGQMNVHSFIVKRQSSIGLVSWPINFSACTWPSHSSSPCGPLSIGLAVDEPIHLAHRPLGLCSQQLHKNRRNDPRKTCQNERLK